MDPETLVLADLERGAYEGLDLHQRSLTLARNHRQPLRIQGEALRCLREAQATVPREPARDRIRLRRRGAATPTLKTRWPQGLQT